MKEKEAIEFLRGKLDLSSLKSWADLGCGSGVFTRALASLLSQGSLIYAIDKTPGAIADKNGVHIKTITLDFLSAPLPFDKIDGFLLANSIHYVKEKSAFIQKLLSHLHESGVIFLVEYDTDMPNRWVPYPLRFDDLEKLFSDHGFSSIERLHSMPSIYQRAGLYSALVRKGIIEPTYET